jgi:hypothetical protein
MNRTYALLLAATIGLGATPSFAQTPPAAPAPVVAPHAGGPGHGFFEEADTNHDGFLTKDEMRAAQDKKLDEMFARLDTNKDGKLSKEELQKGHEEMRNKMRERLQAKQGDAPAVAK